MPVAAASFVRAVAMGFRNPVVASVPSAKYLNTFTPKTDSPIIIKTHVVREMLEIAEKNEFELDEPVLRLLAKVVYIFLGGDKSTDADGEEYISEFIS
jgi:hypothetical protein